ncbi:MAG TPA: histidinol-phosphate transaminase [Anaerolineales bacterium]|nr:histidinol-phosphate transaminase [Anaerolineales bacterium]HNQ94083.1 histidinol-phosphate transaminase [Anaerolineales bacterium]HNS59521.1 histidinol-phosphate transaminase [Anaerolineales bacterium]
MTKPRFNPDLLNVPLYVGGRAIQEIQEKYGLEKVVKLASNESPVGSSPLAIQAALEMMAEAHRYPGVGDVNLRRKLAERFGQRLTENNFLIGNGATDLLRMITQAFTFDGGNNIMADATFPMYKILTTTFSGESRIVPLNARHRFDLDAILAAIDDDTRIVFLCTPNNPTGMIITQNEFDRFMGKVPDHVVVLMDESYHDYVTDSTHAESLHYVEKGRNVIVLRSFSKASGLANLRVGYMIAPVEIAEYVRHALLPFNTSDIALCAAAASMDDDEYNELQRRTVLDGRDYFQSAFSDLDLQTIPSQANFVTFLAPSLGSVRLTELLLQRGFIVRELTMFGMKNAIRVSVGTMEENMDFIKTLKHVLETEGVAA